MQYIKDHYIILIANKHSNIQHYNLLNEYGYKPDKWLMTYIDGELNPGYLIRLSEGLVDFCKVVNMLPLFVLDNERQVVVQYESDSESLGVLRSVPKSEALYQPTWFCDILNQNYFVIEEK